MAARSVHVRVTASVNDFNRAMLSAGRAASGLAVEMEGAERRGTALRDTVVALGPALVPVFTAAVPAVAGLANSLSAAAVGAGTMALALTGVGDSLKAVNAYQLDPTAANLDNVRDAFTKMSGAGEEFVVFLDGLGPKLQGLRDTAQEGFLPGLQAGIEEALTQLPQVRDLVGSTADALGRLAQDAGGALSGPFGTQFLEFLTATTGSSLDTFARTLGNIAEGAAAMFQAFAPLGAGFNDALLESTRNFADWGRTLSDDAGFQGFADYVRETGPQVVDTLGSLAGALIQIGQAAAPVGQVMLPVIGALADALGAVADSPAGPALIGAAVALATLNRAVAAYSAVKASGVAKLLGTLDGVGGLGRETQMRGLAAGIGVLALSLTDLDEAAGLSNTLTFGAIGAMFGPWGAAVGATAGALKDATSANNDLEESIQGVGDTLRSTPLDFEAQNIALADAEAQLDAFRDTVEEGFSVLSPAGYKNTFEGIFGSSDVEEQVAAFVAAAAAVQRQRQAISDLGNEMRGNTGDFIDYTGNLDELESIATSAGPALEYLGLSFDELADLDASEIAYVAAEIRRFTKYSDTAAGKTEAVTGAVRGLSNQMLTTEQSASALAAALDALLGPELSLSEATDAWIVSLRSLGDELAANNKTLRGNTAAALTNRAAIRDRVTAMIDVLNAEADAGASSQRLSRLLSQQRGALLDAGAAAGVSRGQLREYLNTLNLTPKLVTTLLEVRDNASGTIRDVAARLAALNGTRVTTEIETIYRNTVIGGVGNPGVFGLNKADGGVVDFYAGGGVRERHVAQLAPAGAWRVWGEPETGGEAYIPLAHAKRKESLDIWAETGRRLGVAAMSRGGFMGSTPASAASSGPLVVEGNLRITNWATGEARFMGIADDRAERAVRGQRRLDATVAGRS